MWGWTRQRSNNHKDRETVTVIPTRLDEFLATMNLGEGNHDTFNEGVCAMEAVAYVAGEPHSDKPSCACPIISAFIRSWNDDLEDDDRNRLLKPLVPKLVGSRSTPEIEERRAWMVIDWYVRGHATAWLDLAGLAEHAAALRVCDAITDTASAGRAQIKLNAARDAAAAAWDAARAAAGDAAWAAARDAARAAARAQLRPTVEVIQLSAVALIERLLAEGEPRP